MTLFKEASKENKRFTELFDKICKDLDLDKLIVMHFINQDLERIYNSRIRIDDTQLSHLESEVKKYTKKEADLKSEIAKKELLSRNLQTEIENHTLSLEKKKELLVVKKQELIELQNKINQINSSLLEIEQQKKQTEYDIMMKNYSNTAKNDISHKYLRIFLTIITILAIIIVTFLIYKK
jgi:chromosome segregation ATPase